MDNELADFLRSCQLERRLAEATCKAYERDVRACLAFLRETGIEELAAVPNALGSTSTSPRTHSGTPPQRGSGRPPATHASSPSTSAMPTSQRSAATPTSHRTSCTMRRRDWTTASRYRRSDQLFDR